MNFSYDDDSIRASFSEHHMVDPSIPSSVVNFK